MFHHQQRRSSAFMHHGWSNQTHLVVKQQVHAGSLMPNAHCGSCRGDLSYDHWGSSAFIIAVLWLVEPGADCGGLHGSWTGESNNTMMDLSHFTQRDINNHVGLMCVCTVYTCLCWLPWWWCIQLLMYGVWWCLLLPVFLAWWHGVVPLVLSDWHLMQLML